MRTGLSLLKVAVATSVVLSVSVAMAQGQGRGGRGGRGNDPSALLRIEAVQKDLDMTADQKTAVEKLVEEVRADREKAFDGFQDMSREERQKVSAEFAERTQKKVNDILLPHQQVRLQEIGIQVAGPRALLRADVQEKLALNDDQKTKLNEALGFRGFGQGGQGGGNQGGGQQNFQAMREEQEAKAKEILTADQSAQFEKMKGKKIEIDPQELFRGFGGG